MFPVDFELLHYSGCRKSQLAPDPGPLGAELDRLFALAPLPLVELWRKCCLYSCSMKEVFIVFLYSWKIFIWLCPHLLWSGLNHDSVHNMFYIWLCSTLVGSFWIPYLTQHKTIFLKQFTPPLIKPRISQNEIYYSGCCNSPQATWTPWELNLAC